MPLLLIANFLAQFFFQRLQQIERSRLWRAVRRVQRTQLYGCYARLRYGRDWQRNRDVPDPEARLAIVLRSLVAPLYLIISVALSYLAALGVSTLVFIDIAGNGGLTFILPFLMFIFLLALGEDYNILVMTRIREEAHQRPLREAVVTAIGVTGPTVTAAGIVLVGTFAVLAFAGGGGPGGAQVQDIGFGLAIGILMDTFLVRTLLVPSTVALLGRWNWWPLTVEHDADDEPEPGGERLRTPELQP